MARPAARAQPPAHKPETPARPIVDVRTFGLRVEDSTGAVMTANHAALQKAFAEAARIRDPEQTLRVVLPPGRTCVDRPIVIPAGRIELAGYGRDLSIIQMVNAHPAVVVGHPIRNDRLPDTCFADLFGRLDRSAVSKRGERYALVTGPNGMRLVSSGSPLSHGYPPYGTDLTLEVAILADLTPPPPPSDYPHYSICGLASNMFDVQEAPHHLVYRDGEMVWKLRDARRLEEAAKYPYSDAGTAYAIAAKDLPRRGVLRAIFQVRFGKGVIAAWVNTRPDGPPVRVELHRRSPLELKPGLSLPEAPNPYYTPFMVGSFGSRQIGGFVTPIALGGLRVSIAPRYVDTDPIGAPIRRLDGKKVDDFNTFFNFEDEGVLALLPLDDDPSEVARTRMASYTAGSVRRNSSLRGTIWALDDGYFGLSSPGNTVEGLLINGGDIGLAYGSLLHFVARNLGVRGEQHGICGLYRELCYTVAFEDIQAWGYQQAAIVAPSTIFSAFRRIYAAGGQRVLAFPFRSEVQSAESIFIPSSGAPVVFEGDGIFRASGIILDNEGGYAVRRAVFQWREAAPMEWPHGGEFVLENTQYGAIGPEAAVVEFLGAPAGHPRYARIALPYGTGAVQGEALVRVRGNLPVYGEVNGVVPSDLPVFSGGGLATGLVHRSREWLLPPHFGAYQRGRHDLPLLDPVPGLPRRADCVRSGAYGMASPPGWELLEPVAGPGALGTILLDGYRWTASEDPAIGGTFSLFARTLMLNLLLHGQLAMLDSNEVLFVPQLPFDLEWRLETMWPRVEYISGYGLGQDPPAPGYHHAPLGLAAAQGSPTFELDFGVSKDRWADGNSTSLFRRAALVAKNGGFNFDQALLMAGLDPILVDRAGVSVKPRVRGERAGIPINSDARGGLAGATWAALIAALLQGRPYAPVPLSVALSTA
ncbi:MAG: hypothetical protein IRY99_08510, partial [Isosphaeraceae bacterium]|nr:hypothetical protein [Isosphaeraceae bacterium]